jgi:hypothetical protein
MCGELDHLVSVPAKLVDTCSSLDRLPIADDDLLQENSSAINEKLQNMAVSVIRDKVANLTINAILRDRNQLRDGIK